jgi:large subunit ribosomal protein L18
MALVSKFKRRAQRNRFQLKKKGGHRSVRLSVHRSANHIYAQVIDDVQGITVASASTREKDAKVKYGGNTDAAKAIGTLVAERALKAKVDIVKFDRGGFLYHGRIKALADAAREAGLKF